MVSGVLTCGTVFQAAGVEEAAPTTPAVSNGTCWFDSTDHSGLECMANNSANKFKLLLSGVDINPLTGQVTATHLASPLPVAQGGTANAYFTVSGPASSAKTYTFPNANATIPQTIGNGTVSLGTPTVTSGTCTSAIDGGTATGVVTTDVIMATANADPTGVTGFAPATTGSLYVWAYPTADHVNFKLCNNTLASITPASAVTLNWRVIR